MAYIYGLLYHEHGVSFLASLLIQRSIEMTLHHCLFFQFRSFFLKLTIESYKLFDIVRCLQLLQTFYDSLGDTL